MKNFISVFVLTISVTFVLSAPQGNPNDVIQLVRYVNENNGLGDYKYTYEQNNGQIVSEVGQLKPVGPSNTPAVVVYGQYTWTDPITGIIYWVNYTADENGFHPVVGTGPGGIQGGQDAQSIEPNALKSLVG